MNNLHPLFVHFPIALFSLYALLELIPSKKVRNNTTVFFIKLFLLLSGTLSAWPTLMSGESIEHMFSSDPMLNGVVEMHSLWASTSVAIF
ncbi:hypothetical protein IPJ72_02140 [Candidatus Peregrinibacteria bacterium]|nr:MAG: hypothetical protein IPJ72_02140 [Candidatus Peregrinibacteria bacterium]